MVFVALQHAAYSTYRLPVSSVWNSVTSSPRCAESAIYLDWWGKSAFCNVSVGSAPTCTVTKFRVLRKAVNFMNLSQNIAFSRINILHAISLLFNKKLKYVTSLAWKSAYKVSRSLTESCMNVSTACHLNFNKLLKLYQLRESQFLWVPYPSEEHNVPLQCERRASPQFTWPHNIIVPNTVKLFLRPSMLEWEGREGGM